MRAHALRMGGKLSYNPGDGAASMKRTRSQRYRTAGTTFLCCTCSICFLLCIVCICLATFVVILDQKVEAATFRNDQSPVLQSIMSKEQQPDINFRLPKEVQPLEYDLYLFPNLREGTFQGKVTILIDVKNKRNYIALHQKDLTITSTVLRTVENEENYDIELMPPSDISKYEIFVVTTKNEIQPGLYNLTFDFNGGLNDKIVGFYSSKYKDSQNRTRYIATSKLEPTYARRAYPCFDEPAFKAAFSIKLVHPSGDCYNALSNMNVESVSVNQPTSGFTTVTFAKSVPMSTYLSCFIVSDFVALSKNAKGLKDKQFPVSVYTTSAQKEKGSFALDIGVKIIEFYINLFKIDYPLPKMDMAAIPDFVSGAMENWGLVTYREARLLYDSNTSSTANKQSIVHVIGHEFAHMWFGNLVTMKWWNDLWLNEGFASFMEYKSADTILPDWGLMDRFLINQLHSVFITDAKLSSHPIVQTVNNPDEITSIFDEISYKKGSSILRMMEDFIGQETFYTAISSYLNKFAYQNAETADLFKILQEAIGSKINLTAIMDTWTRQKGFPVLTVRKGQGNKYILTQKRFLSDPDAEYDPAESEYRYKWTIPITYITNNSGIATLFWFDKDADDLIIELDEPAEWIKFNKDQVGYYRVNYENSEWEVLSNTLRWYHQRLSVADRANLLEDAFSLASAGLLDYSTAMDMTAYLPRENHAVPWSVASSKFTEIDTLLSSTDISTMFKTYVRDLVDSLYHDVTWKVDNIEDHVTLRLRTTVLDLACAVGHTECLEEAGRQFIDFINNPEGTRLHPDVKGLIYYYGIQHSGTEKEWNILFDTFVNETDSAEKLKLMKGLTGISSSWILNKFITLASNENYVRSQDFFGCLQSISNNPVGTPLVWDWVRANWEFLVKRYTLNDRYLGQLIPAITKTFATETKLNEIKAFFVKYPEAGAGATSRAKALETVSNNIKWLSENRVKLEKWLNSHVNSK